MSLLYCWKNRCLAFPDMGAGWCGCCEDGDQGGGGPHGELLYHGPHHEVLYSSGGQQRNLMADFGANEELHMEVLVIYVESL